MPYQGAETCHFGFEVRNEVEEPRNNVLTKSWKRAVLDFEAIKKHDSKK